MPLELDDADRRLLDCLQREVPLVERPFEAIGAQAGMSEAEVIRRLLALKPPRAAGADPAAKPASIIRQISAIFDSRALGYESCLVAARVEDPQVAAAAAEINRHPGVSHNYRRNHSYNLWYTVTVPPDSRLGLARTVDVLHERSGAIVTRLMPAIKLYKIGVKFNLGAESDLTARTDTAAGDGRHAEPVRLSNVDQRMIRVLQQDLPIEPRPFDLWAQVAEVEVETLLAAAKRFVETGCMRRFSAVLRHRQAGFGANAMGAWVVPPDQHDAFGNAAASFAAVSHCYLRPTYEDWPYSLFTMVHGKSKSECEQVLDAISAATGISQYAALYSSEEFKKVRVKYFTGDIESWESTIGAAPTRLLCP